MTQYLEHTDTGSEGGLKNGRMRLPYVKPFVRNLDVLDTEAKLAVIPTENATFTSGSFGPS